MYRILFYIILLIAISCTSNNRNYYLEAVHAVDTYNTEQEISKLDTALYYVNQAISESKKDEIDWSVISLKLEIFLLKGEADAGKLFLNSLKPEQFDRPYQRQMYMNFFNALKEKHIGALSNDLYLDNIRIINSYISSEQDEIIMQNKKDSLMLESSYLESVIDLLRNEKEIRDISEIDLIIDSLQSVYGGDRKTYDALKNSLIDL